MIIGRLIADSLKEQDRTRRGELLACARKSCQTQPAQWFNHSTRHYYCGACASRINQANPEARELYGHELCTKEFK